MEYEFYLTPAQAGAKLGMSKATITRCVQNGAPVHRWGATGHRYRIDMDEFVAWMEAQGQKESVKSEPIKAIDVKEMARRRRESVRKKHPIGVAI